MRQFLKDFILTRSFIERLISIIGIITIIWVMKGFATFFLAAFLCAYLFHEATMWWQKHLIKFEKKAPKEFSKFLKWLSREKVLLTFIYLFFAFICVIAIRDIWPALTADMIGLLRSLSVRFGINLGISEIESTLTQWQQWNMQIGNFLGIISPTTDSGTIISELLRISGIFFQIIFAYILSYIWLLEYNTVQKYFSQIKDSPFSFFYRDVRAFLEKIKKSFGLVFLAQSKIAVANTLLTMVGLLFIGIFYGQLSLWGSWIFPYFLALGCITFFSSFVPILGVFIGGIPIVFAGVIEYPGWSIVIAIVVMLSIIHAFEAYFLNPRIVGQSLKLPTPIVFLILFVAEHFMGIIGFFLWVPLYLLSIEFLESIGKIIQNIKPKGQENTNR